MKLQFDVFKVNMTGGIYNNGYDYSVYRNQPLEADAWYMGDSVSNSIRNKVVFEQTKEKAKETLNSALEKTKEYVNKALEERA